jgi:hypothetical protein
MSLSSIGCCCGLVVGFIVSTIIASCKGMGKYKIFLLTGLRKNYIISQCMIICRRCIADDQTLSA